MSYNCLESMSELSNENWLEQRQELAKTLGVEASLIKAYLKEDGSIHIQVGKPSENNSVLTVIEEEHTAVPSDQNGGALHSDWLTGGR